MHDGRDVEKIHTKFFRRLLCVRKSTNISALYGELGCYPFSVMRQIKMIKFWVKIIKLGDTEIVKKVYLMLKQDVDSGNTYNSKKWAFCIKNILTIHG
jgi:hypothetical protein